MLWAISDGVTLAQLTATMAYADQGGANSRIQFYTTTIPETLGSPVADTPQFEIVLAKPCGEIAGNVWTLIPNELGGTLVGANGIPRWARWIAGNGNWVADGNVSDTTHDGAFRLIGGETPEGDDSPMLYAGGLVVLGAISLT